MQYRYVLHLPSDLHPVVKMNRITVHLIANAHLDPVWVWDWREGLTEGISTVRAVLDLMDEHPEMTFIRGEAVIYEHIEKVEPELFARIQRYAREGRWDVVGGTYIQPDTNLPATETLARHFTLSQSYFRSRFGRAPKIAWAADSFGHSAGLPEILARAGMTGFAFTRPGPRDCALENSAFWWESPGGSRVLAYRPVTGWYGAERDEIFRRMDAILEAALTHPMRTFGCFYGIGNHGGGPTRRQLRDLREWIDRHPEVNVVHSGLHRFFEVLSQEEANFPGGKYPVHRGELNFCLRGCYASVAKFKYAYRHAEAGLVRAEKTNTVISAWALRPPADLEAAWKAVLFNSFHDILPGSSIERVYDEQLAWLGRAWHEAREAEFAALHALAAKIDTSVSRPEGDHPACVPFLVWNPHPHSYHGPVELEACLDARPLMDLRDRDDLVEVTLTGPEGDAVAFQEIRTEHSSLPYLPWRKRLLFQATIPAMGWSVFQVGWKRKPEAGPDLSSASIAAADAVRKGDYEIVARKGSEGVEIFHRGKPLFGAPGLSLINVEDPWGSWGGMEEEPESLHLSKIQERWAITEVEILESGPLRSSLWVRFAGRRSRLDLTFSLTADRPAVDVFARIFWDERSSRLKMVFPMGERVQTRFEVPGGVAERGPMGEVPGGRWVKVGENLGFASDALYNFDADEGNFRATIIRASRYANDVVTPAEQELWRPAVDAGELKFRFLLTADPSRLPRLAQELEQPVIAELTTAHPGALLRSGSFFALEPESAQLLALKPALDGAGWIMRVQETSGHAAQACGTWMGNRFELGEISPWGLGTYRLLSHDNRWIVERTTIAEEVPE